MTIQNILCDRDGTLIVDKHYLANPNEVELLPTVYEGVALVHHHQRFIAVISNQSGIGRGYCSNNDVDACNHAMCKLLQKDGDTFNAILYCPHAPEEQCSCRKPAIGMWCILEKNYTLKANESVMIGDKKEDMEFAIRSGFPYAFVVYTGKGVALINTLNITMHNTCIDITQVFAHHYNIETLTTTIYASPNYLIAIEHILSL